MQNAPGKNQVRFALKTFKKGVSYLGCNCFAVAIDASGFTSGAW